MAKKKYTVLHPISSLSQDKTLMPGEIYEAELTPATEKMLIDMGRIEPYTPDKPEQKGN